MRSSPSNSGKSRSTGDARFQPAKAEPLIGEVVDERARTRVGQHAPDLLVEHRGVAKLVLRGEVQQLIVRNAAPQEERQPRGQVEVADRGRLRRRSGGQGVKTPRRRHAEGALARRACRPAASASATGPSTRYRKYGLARMRSSAVWMQASKPRERPERQNCISVCTSLSDTRPAIGALRERGRESSTRSAPARLRWTGSS